MRRRQVVAAAQAEDDDDTTPLDEEDQETVVQELQAEVEKQQENMHRTFCVLCYAAAVASLLFAVLDEYTSNIETSTPSTSGSMRALRWLHVVLAALLHLTTSSVAIAHIRWYVYALLLLNVVFAVCVNMIWDDVLGLGLAISNFLTLSVGMLLKWDKRDSKQALEDLVEAKYRHKNL